MTAYNCDTIDVNSTAISLVDSIEAHGERQRTKAAKYLAINKSEKQKTRRHTQYLS
ncbi:hypothetical protein PGB90_000995 [Kerria lacca]